MTPEQRRLKKMLDAFVAGGDVPLWALRDAVEEAGGPGPLKWWGVKWNTTHGGREPYFQLVESNAPDDYPVPGYRFYASVSDGCWWKVWGYDRDTGWFSPLLPESGYARSGEEGRRLAEQAWVGSVLAGVIPHPAQEGRWEGARADAEQAVAGRAVVRERAAVARRRGRPGPDPGAGDPGGPEGG